MPLAPAPPLIPLALAPPLTPSVPVAPIPSEVILLLFSIFSPNGPFSDPTPLFLLLFFSFSSFLSSSSPSPPLRKSKTALTTVTVRFYNGGNGVSSFYIYIFSI